MPNYRNYQYFIISAILAFTFCSSFKGFAQSEDKLGSWFIYNGFFNVSPKVELFFDTQLRTYEVFSNREAFIIRPYFNYNLTKSFQAGLGLEYLKAWSYAEDADDKISLDEFRVTLQSILGQKIDRISIQHRYRYEFRKVDQENLQRMRYRILLAIPLNNKIVEKGTFFLNAYNEILVNTEPKLSLNQNWLYFSFGYQFSKSLNFQFGHLFVSKESTTHHRLQFFLTQKLYFYDKK